MAVRGPESFPGRACSFGAAVIRTDGSPATARAAYAVVSPSIGARSRSVCPTISTWNEPSFAEALVLRSWPLARMLPWVATSRNAAQAATVMPVSSKTSMASALIGRASR